MAMMMMMMMMKVVVVVVVVVGGSAQDSVCRRRRDPQRALCVGVYVCVFRSTGRNTEQHCVGGLMFGMFRLTPTLSCAL